MPASPKAACFADLKRRILTCDLPPGEDLDETSLTVAYGISRTPLREVFQRLAGDGYVKLTANRGAKVGVIDLLAVRAMVETAPMIHAGIARLAATYRTDRELAALAEAERQFERAAKSGDGRAAALADHRFHAMTGQMARNPYLVTSLERMLIDQTRAAPILDLTISKGPPPSGQVSRAIRGHRALISAIAAADADAAASAAVAHWMQAREGLNAYLRPAELPSEVGDADLVNF